MTMDIAVLAGGRSPEHDISLASVAQVLAHLDRDRWRVWPVYIDREGSFWPSPEPLPAGQGWHPCTANAEPMRPGAALDMLLDHARIEAVLPILHGPFGEDGTIQGMLELYDLPCVGSGCAASAVAITLAARSALSMAWRTPPISLRNRSETINPEGSSAPRLMRRPVLRRSSLIWRSALFPARLC